jgi:glycine cleavage system transcriptional repressor
MAEQPVEPRSRSLLHVSGPDQPGLLDQISKFLLERGGKIEEIRVAALGGHFTFLARLVGPEAALQTIRSQLPRLAEVGQIHAEMHAYSGDADAREGAFPFRFTATGKGQASTMQSISHLMRVLNINIEDITTRITGHAAEGQPAPFELELRLSVPRQTPISMLRDYLGHLCREKHVEWELKPA